MSRKNTPPPAPAWYVRTAQWAARSLDRWRVARISAAFVLSSLHVTAVLSTPPQWGPVGVTAVMMSLGVIILIFTGAWRTGHRWITLWLISSYMLPGYAPFALLVGQVWVLSRAWVEGRGLIEASKRPTEHF